MKKYIAIAVCSLGLGVIGNVDYADALTQEADAKVHRPLRAWLLPNSTQPATLETCRNLGLLLPGITVNKQRAGIRWWQRHCVEFDNYRPILGHKEKQ